MFVYLITNTVNGKRYVGQTKKSLKRRLRQHGRPHSTCRYLRAAIEKYGKENFVIESIIEIPTQELANEFEQEYIRNYCTLAPNGYNLTTGGLVFSHSEETLKRMSAVHKGRPCSEETKRKISEAQIGKVISEETRRRLSKSHKGYYPSEEHRKKLVQKLTGRPVSEATRQKISSAQKGRSLPEERRQRMIGHPVSEETREKIKRSLTDKKTEFIK